MKRILSLILALVMMLSVSITAVQADSIIDLSAEQTITVANDLQMEVADGAAMTFIKGQVKRSGNKTSVRFYMKNTGDKTIKQFKVKASLYDSSFRKIKTVTTGYYKKSLKPGKSAWTPWVKVGNGNVFYRIYSMSIVKVTMKAK